MNINSYQILEEARENKYAIGSFNFCTAEVLRVIVLTAQNLNSPIIVSTSENEADFIGMGQAVALVDAWRKEFPNLRILLNLDHGKSLEKIEEAITAGYNMVHFDGSALSYEENIKKTKEVVDYIHGTWNMEHGTKIIVEGELGYLRGSSSLHQEILEIKEDDLTQPEQAVDFVKKTGIDSLAVVIGNAHGVFVKSSEKLYLDRLRNIHEAVGDKAFLVLHGGSGISDDDIKGAINCGIVKINVNTEIRLAYRDALKNLLINNPNESTTYKILGPAMDAAQKIVESKIRLFNNMRIYE